MGATSSAGNVDSTKTYELMEPGVYPARCIAVIELGTHSREYKGEFKDKKEIMIIWELSELMEDGRPFTINWKGTNSLSDKARLYKMLNSWRGKPFQPEELARFEMKAILDKCCILNITRTLAKNGKEYNNVDSVMPLPKGMKCEERVNPLVDFGIGDVATPEFEKLWPWVQKIVLESKEMEGHVPAEVEPELPEESDILF